MRFVLSSLLAVALLGCSSNVGPDGLLIGAPCNDEFDCVTGAFCLRRSTFPDGMCTTVCGDDADCRGASACVDVEAGACLLTCERDEDCGREGYVCRAESRLGAVGEVMACVGG